MDSVGLQIYCKDCGISFLVCRACYRGQKYCSVQCRKNGYEKNRRVARKKYRDSLEAKADHRDRQKRYRERLRQKGDLSENSSNHVMDQASRKSEFEVLTATTAPGSVKELSSLGVKIPCCWLCGQIIHFIYGSEDEYFGICSI